MISITGTHLNYYFHCHRQLWLFAHNVQMEQESEAAKIGKLISETTYEREKHEVAFETHAEADFSSSIKLDFIDHHNGVVHEVKKSKSFEKAHEWQVLHYIYTLKSMGILKENGDPYSGELDYPLQRQKVNILLTPEKETKLVETIHAIQNIVDSDLIPQRIEKNICRSCSYYELCWS